MFKNFVGACVSPGHSIATAQETMWIPRPPCDSGVSQESIKSEDTIEYWGDSPATWAFLNADGFARGLILNAENGPIAQLINMRPDNELSINEFTRTLMETCGKKLEIEWYTSKSTRHQRLPVTRPLLKRRQTLRLKYLSSTDYRQMLTGSEMNWQPGAQG